MIERHPVLDRAAWLAMRAKDLTASDLGAAMGVDPYKSRLQLYGEKAGLLTAEAETRIMRRGRWLEPAVVAAIRETHPDWEVGYPLGLYLRDPELRLGCTPDAVVSKPNQKGIWNCQLKVVSKTIFDRDWADGPPLGYQLQTACENMLMEADDGMLAALVIDTYSAELMIYPVHRYTIAEERIRDMAKTFWADIAEGRRPPAGLRPGRRDDRGALSDLRAGRPAARSHRRQPAGRPARRAAPCSRRDQGLQKDVDAIDTEIKAKLGAAERAVLPGWSISLEDPAPRRAAAEGLSPAAAGHREAREGAEGASRMSRVVMARERLEQIADEMQQPLLFPKQIAEYGREIKQLIPELIRAKAIRKASAASVPMSPELAQNIWDDAQRNPDDRLDDIARRWGVVAGRVTEVLQGKHRRRRRA